MCPPTGREPGRCLRLAAAIALLVAGPARAQALYQTDLRIAALELTASGASVTAVATVVTDAQGEARGVQVEFLLPAGVGLLETAAGCAAGPSPPGVTSLRARVVCQLGTLPEGGKREVFVRTTAPPAGVALTFAAFARSDTPDSRPRNNYAEKTLPR